jgi:KDO2-lipid IV(A) lauroyltransferase
MDKALLAHRAGGGIHIFPRNTSVIPILRWLKEGKALGALADQDTGVDSLFCEFFGRPAKTPTGAVLLAQATKARLITGFCWRQADGRYVVEFEGAIPLPERKDRDPLAFWPAAQEYTRRIEAKIRQHPEQWVWMHRRWKSSMDQDSNGWQSRQAPACRDRIAQWVAAGRPELKA